MNWKEFFKIDKKKLIAVFTVFIVLLFIGLSIHQWSLTLYLNELVEGWAFLVIAGLLIPYAVFSLIFYWKNFSKTTSIILLSIMIFLLIPFPNFYELCECPEFEGATKDDCLCGIYSSYLNGLMLFINFGSFRIYNRLDYYHVNFSYFIIAIVLSILFAYLITKFYFKIKKSKNA